MIEGMILYLTQTLLVVSAGFFVNVAYKNQLNSAGGREVSRQEALNLTLLCSIFLLLFSVSALRIGIGNDYWEYRTNFLLIAGGDVPVSYEIGFRMLVRVLQILFGLDNYRVTFGVMAFVTCAFFLKGIYDTADWFGFSLLLFLMNGFYLMSFSNIRYYFAFAVVLYSTKYLLRKQYVPFVLWLCFAALFHKTALIVIPAFLIAYYLKWTKATLWLIPATSAILIVGKSLIRKLLFLFYPFYEGSVYDVENLSIVNILKCAAVLILGILYYKKAVAANQKANMFFNLNLFALLLYLFGTYIPELSRICYFFVQGQIFLVPMILLKIENKKQRRFWMIAVSLAYLCYFAVFLYKGKSQSILIFPYMTWIFT